MQTVYFTKGWIEEPEEPYIEKPQTLQYVLKEVHLINVNFGEESRYKKIISLRLSYSSLITESRIQVSSCPILVVVSSLSLNSRLASSN